MNQKQLVIFISISMFCFQVTSAFAGLKDIKEVQLDLQHGKDISEAGYPVDLDKLGENEAAPEDNTSSERITTSYSEATTGTSYPDLIKGGVNNPKFVITDIFTPENAKKAGVVLGAGITLLIVVALLPVEVPAACVTAAVAGVIYVKNDKQFFVSADELNSEEREIIPELSEKVCH